MADTRPQLASRSDDRPIIFFDGVCGLCNAVVDRLLRLDRKQVFLFAPLQGETAQRLLPPLDEDWRQWSILLLDEKGLHDKSDAALGICRKLGGVWSVVALLRFVPRFLRDPVYRVIARSRYRWFGKKEVCRIPTVGERARFLP